MYKLDDLGLKNWISRNQFGFMKGRSTLDAIDNLVTNIEKNKQPKLLTLCLFFYIRGAFDNAWHPGIVNKLKDSGCPIWMVKLLHSYLSDIIVSYNNEFSLNIEKSCPQGGILSPLLWNININDLLDLNLPNNSHIQAYADDVFVIIAGKTKSDLEFTTSEVFRIFDRWASNNKLVFDSKKTEAAIFTSKRIVPKPALVFNGNVIEIKEKAKYLGVTLDRKLLWTEHIRNRINSAKQYSTKLMCAAKCTWGLKPRALKNMYLSVIESTILYAVPVWIAALNKKYIIRMLSSVQRLYLILITKSFRTAQTDVLTALAGVLPIDLRAKELTIMPYAKKGRPEYWPEFPTPGIPISSRTKSHILVKQLLSPAGSKISKLEEEVASLRAINEQLIKKMEKIESGEVNPPKSVPREEKELITIDDIETCKSP
ncbi:hypothetical protein QYM36_008223 [Artemia franciscana]|uniref:Reverse transcriptase domain-containing protein n=1 Tax=Artemia franciscana TaxID=6661 RepID=A0AA88LEJ4_ARTSF|nr:hypothetical protein QYM36_008223 [Artemia franciscana]